MYGDNNNEVTTRGHLYSKTMPTFDPIIMIPIVQYAQITSCIVSIAPYGFHSLLIKQLEQ